MVRIGYWATQRLGLYYLPLDRTGYCEMPMGGILQPGGY